MSPIGLLQHQKLTAANSASSGSAGGGTWSIQQIADVLGSPVGNVEVNWPLIQKWMEFYDATHRLHAVGALATIGVEASVFAPIDEYGSDAYFTYMYDITSPDANRREVARQLGNIYPGDGILFHGRGELQLTGRGNYRRLGTIIGVDLEGNPELAKDPDIAAAVFVIYFSERALWNQCTAQNWLAVRRGVNGGLTGIRPFLRYVMTFTYLNVLEDWRVSVLSDGASHFGDPYVWDGELPGGFDCSGFAKYVHGVVGKPLTSYTDAAYDETVFVSEADALPADLVFYQYRDPSQPNTRFPHMGLWLDQNRTLDSRGGVGVGIHPHVVGAIKHVRRYP